MTLVVGQSGLTSGIGTGTSTLGMWNPMVFVEANEVGESIEMIYVQTSNYSRTGGFPPYHDERAVKIIYSCVDGKWNKSEPIYGKVIHQSSVAYDFSNQI